MMTIDGAAQRDIDMLWELAELQPDNPKIATTAHSILSRDPANTDARMVLARYHDARHENDEARRLWEEVVASGDEYALDAARSRTGIALRHDAAPDALKWAQFVLDRTQAEWGDWFDLGVAQVQSGEFNAGYARIDRAVELCARTDPDALSEALNRRVLTLMETFSPAEVFVPAVEALAQVREMDEAVAYPLAWAYAQTGRFDDATQLCLRMLSAHPVSAPMRSVLDMVRGVEASLEQHGHTKESLICSGALTKIWRDRREKVMGIGTAAALHALGDLLPDEATATLLPPQAAETVDGTMIPDIALWHAGQSAGVDGVWGLPGAYRLMTLEEIEAMNAAVEEDPAAHPGWQMDTLEEDYTQVLTDDAGSCLIEKADGAIVLRKSGVPDIPVARNLAEWLWGRVKALGGRSPRRRTPSNETGAAGKPPLK